MDMNDVISQAIKTQIELNTLQNKTIDYLQKRLEEVTKENKKLRKQLGGDTK